MKDLQDALRMFRRSPAFTLAAVAALALGIGATSAVFSIVNAVLLKPVPFAEPDRVVILQARQGQGRNGAGSPAKFQHWREQKAAVQLVSAFRTNVVNFSSAEVVEQLRAGQVSRDYFTLVGAHIVRGRTFTAEEDLPNGPRVAVLSEALWDRRFGRDDAMLGRTITLGGDAYQVIGVAALMPGFEEFGARPDLWIPFQLDPASADQGHYFQVVGRLADGVTLQQAEQVLAASSDGYRQKFPNGIQNDESFTTQPIREALVTNVRSTLLVLGGAVSFVLLIACANVASLLLARATGRRREMGVRTALGATRWRIVRQLLVESVLLSSAGGVLGLALGFAGIRGLLTINTAGLPRLGVAGSAVGLDWRVLSVTVFISVATGILFGLAPALHASKTDLGVVLKEGSSRSGTGARHTRTRSILVVAEIALALILLVGSALLIRSAIALSKVDPGFDTTNVLTMRMSLNDPRFRQAEAVEQAVRRSVERLKAVPGVVEASATCCLPLEGGYGLPFLVAGRPLTNGPFHGGGGWRTVSSGYFEVFRIPVRRGRTFTVTDTASSPRVAIINEAMAREFWPKADPLQDRIVIGRGVMREFASESERQIVGVVADSRDGGLNSTPGPMMFIPQAQVPDAVNALNLRIAPMAWIVRARSSPGALSRPVQDVLRETTGLAVSDVRTIDEIVLRSMSRTRFNMWLMTVFGISALLLAAIGIYGLMAYSVEQRTQEIGIRMALGAETSAVRNMIVGQGARLAAIGVVIGVAGAYGLTRYISTFLFGVGVLDPAVFVSVPVVLGAVAVLAAWIPALRASRVNPIEALRIE